MHDFPTAPDASLSLWQSAAAAITRRRARSAAEGEAAPTGDRSMEETGSGAAKPAANDDGASPAVDMTAPLNAATAAYVEASRPEATAERKVESLRAMSGSRKPETSALFHKLAEARATENSLLERSLRTAIKATPEIDYDEETIWEDVAEYFVDIYRLFQRPRYNSWMKEGKGDLNYATIEWRLPSKGTVALIADWGTGTPRAIDVLRAACSFDPDAIIHLGDIYTTGLTDECEDNFLAPMRHHAVNSRTKEPIPIFNLAGNHDYYSGGHGYHWLLGQLNKGAQAQQASYFSLKSEDDGWQFLAMDTGFNSRKDIMLAHSMGSVPREDEITWLHHKLGAFGGRTMLLSHHQPFSNHDRLGGDPNEPPGKDTINDRLIQMFRPYFDKVAGWFWGHEHTLEIFREFMGLGKGRCVGHGARPVAIGDLLAPSARAVPSEEIHLSVASDGRHYNHGFEIIQLNGAGRAADAGYFEVGRTSEGMVEMRELYREEMG